MRLRLVSLVIGCAIFVLHAVVFAGFEKGERAFRAGKFKIAQQEFLKSAKSGYAPAQYHLAFIHHRGFAGKKDFEQAAYWYELAAEQGYAFAQNNLAELYANGQGVKQNYKTAAKWYLKAARRGVLTAMYGIGELYRTGKGVPKNIKKALHWLTKSATRGYPESQMRLGDLYYKGRDVPRNLQESSKWIKQAAKQGISEAQYLLAQFYQKGVGAVPKNMVYAYVWMSLAAREKKEIKPKVKAIGAKLTPSQRSRAKSIYKKLAMRY